jgi:PIN domain nuclease of toxin-antitoxin system
VRYLLDTHLLIWIADRNLNPLLPDAARQIVISGDNDVLFSAASIWEIVIKGALGRSDFRIDAKMLRLGALASGFAELPITSAHTLAVADLPTIHKDPFDRLLVAQVRAEDITLLTRDETVAAYGANVILV